MPRSDLPRFAGWWGHDRQTRFQMGPQFEPIAGAQGWQISNPPMLSTAPLLASLEIFQRAGMHAPARKIHRTHRISAAAIETRLAGLVGCHHPEPVAERGCQLSLRIARPAAEAKRCHDR